MVCWGFSPKNYVFLSLRSVCTIFVPEMEELSKEDSRIIFKLHQKFGKALKDYGLIADGDKVLIGLSGGKDSLTLVELFAKRAAIFKPKFEVVAAHVSMSNVPYQSDIEYLRNYCEQFNIPFHHVTGSFDASTDTRKSPCFLCAWNRRKKLFELAKELGCTKIALGHHQDDILATLLMNLTFQGAFSTMPPYLKMNHVDVDIIRPMCLIAESEIKEMARIRGFVKPVKNCPYETDSHRSDMSQVMALLEKMNPQARHSLWGSMTNIQTDYLPKKI